MQGTEYVIGRDDEGLTKRERQVAALFDEGLEPVQISETLGLTRQRVHQIAQSLVSKGRAKKIDNQYVTLPNSAAGDSDKSEA